MPITAKTTLPITAPHEPTSHLWCSARKAPTMPPSFPENEKGEACWTIGDSVEIDSSSATVETQKRDVGPGNPRPRISRVPMTPEAITKTADA
jgi:hypothetical protein